MPFWPVAAFAAFFMSAIPALAQQQRCAERADMLKRLAKEYREAPVAIGIVSDGKLFELLSTPAGKTWTIIVTTPEGWSCIAAAGVDLSMIISQPTGPHV